MKANRIASVVICGHAIIQDLHRGHDELAVDIATLAQFDPARFASGATGYPRTIDEESSGIIDVEDLFGRGVFLFDAQVHTNLGLHDPVTQVEHGQLLAMRVDWKEIFGHDDDGHHHGHGEH